MKRNHKIFIGTAIIIIIIIVVGYLFAYYSNKDVAVQQPVTKKIRCEKFAYNVSKDDGARIEQYISTIADTSAMSLAFKKRHVYTIGEILDYHVPPFQFLAYIFSHPELVKEMAKIRRSKSKYDRFVEGLRKSLLKESESKCFEVTAKGFIAFLGVNEERTMKLLQAGVKNGRVDKKSFRPFIGFLIDEKSK